MDMEDKVPNQAGSLRSSGSGDQVHHETPITDSDGMCKYSGNMDWHDDPEERGVQSDWSPNFHLSATTSPIHSPHNSGYLRGEGVVERDRSGSPVRNPGRKYRAAPGRLRIDVPEDEAKIPLEPQQSSAYITPETYSVLSMS